MQISSTRSGLYPAVLPATRGAGTGASAQANADVSTTNDTRALQPIAAPVAASDAVTNPNTEASRALLFARQRAGADVLEGVVQSGQSENESRARRAVAEYNSVATQGRRFETGGVLVGIDVFA